MARKKAAGEGRDVYDSRDDDDVGGDGGGRIQFRRYYHIVKALKRHRYGLTKRQLLDVLSDNDIKLPSDRTLQRDLRELINLGYHIVCKENRQYVILNREKLMKESFSYEEIQALHICRDLFTYFEGTHFKRTIDSALNAVIGSQMTPFDNEDLEECRDNFMIHHGWRHEFFDKKELIDDITYAVNNNVRLQAVYKKPNAAPETITIDPYRIVLYHDSLYLLAKKISQDEADTRALRLYHVSRFESIEYTDVEFTKSRKLINEYEERLSHCFGISDDGELCDIEVDFDKSVEYVVRERLWHKSQTIETHTDRVTLKLRVYRSGEFTAWIRGWGDMVKDVRFTPVGKMK